MSQVPVARDFMAKSLITLRPDMDIYEAIDILIKHHISGAPVVDENKRLLGIISEKDCLRVFVNGAFFDLAGGQVADYMSKTVTTIDADADVFKVADVLMKNTFRRLPVLDDGVLVGQVSRHDVLLTSRKMLESPQAKKQWTDSKYITPEMQAVLDSKQTHGGTT